MKRNERKNEKILMHYLYAMIIVLIILIVTLMFVKINRKQEVNQKDESNLIQETFESEEDETIISEVEVKNETTSEKTQEHCCCDSPIHNYTKEEILLLACTVYSEAGGCSDEHQMYVASVILNRVNSDLFPNTITEVIYQTGPVQYSCTVNGMIAETMDKYNGNCSEYEFKFLENTYQNVLYVLDNGSLLPENVLYQATKKQGSGVYKKIGNTYFCYQ